MGRNFEKLIEHIINSDDASARKLFHSIVVNKSRRIYENLEMEGMPGQEEEDMEEGIGDIMDNVELDQTSDMMEDDDEDMAPESGMDDRDDMDDMSGGPEDEAEDEYMDDDMGGDDMGEERLENRVDDLESALDELKAEFEKLMSDEEGEEDEDMEDEAEDEDMEDEEAEDEEGEEDESEELEEGYEEDEDEEMEESFIREYTENVGTPYKGGKVASTSEEGSTNKKSTVAGPNKIGGGTYKNLVQGGEEKGRTAPSTKPMGVNDPKAAAKGAFKTQARKAVTKEQGGINKDSVFESRKSTKRTSKK